MSDDVATACAERACRGEDRLCTIDASVGAYKYSALIVCDGHGGSRAAEVCVQTMADFLTRSSSTHVCAKELLTDAFAHVAQTLSGETSGCVLTVCLVFSDHVVCANVGDAAAFAVPSHGRPVRLTTSHALHENAHERERVRRAGATIAAATTPAQVPAGPVRAWPGGLAVGRAFGNADCGRYVSATPDVSVTPLVLPAVVVVGSDGLWDALPTEMVAQMLLAHRGVDSVVGRAWKRRQTDDVSCAVAYVGLSPPARRGWRLGFWTESTSSVSSASTSASDVESDTADAPPRERVVVAGT